MNEHKWTGPAYVDPESLPTEARPYVDFRKTRSDEQRENYAEIIDHGVCPFCQEHRDQFMDVDWVYEGEHWAVARPGFPYPAAEEHFMAIAQYHAEEINDMATGAWEELVGTIFSRLVDEYEMESGGIAMRFGNIFQNNGASVRHLHAHLFKNFVEQPEEVGKLKFKISG